MEQQPWWDRGGPRRVVVFAFLAALVLACLAIFPDINQFYENNSGLRHLLHGSVVVLGLALAFLELRHSGEANEHRAEHNRLTAEANQFRNEANASRAEANRLSGENNGLHEQTLELQRRIHQLQVDIEKNLNKVRLYVRAQSSGNKVRLDVANLSDFDVWINQVELIVTQVAHGTPGRRIFAGARRISQGYTEDGYQLYDALVGFNDNRADHFDMKFQVRVVARGRDENPVTADSPEYHLTLELEPAGKIKLKVLKW